MLSELDDTLWHQLPTTFDHVGTSDPRFFDRYWFAVYEPEGRGALQFTLGVYNNMNVVDGGFVVIHDGRQHNLRVSRSLRPRFDTTCGPMRVEMVRPFEQFRLLVDPGGHHVHGELEWVGVLPPEEEKPHFERARGRVAQEYQRFDQIGECSGWLDIDGDRIDVDRWWGCRDHSWGVRPSMGIPEPVTGPTPPPAQVGSLFAFLFFSTDTLAGHVQVMERGTARVYLTGLLRDRSDLGAPDIHVRDATLHIEFHEGTRRFRTVDLDLEVEDGRRLALHADALGPSIAMPGLGYSGGYDDGRGLGVWRGDDHREAEVWDVRHPSDVVLADGSVQTPVHRIQPVRVQVSGDAPTSVGTGSLTMIANGRLPQHGLD
ncbi:MAG TPA: hypothetical protein VGQ20_11085 [Acidimicrobiales bacterium]|jgi:hypothetical protein|nr:hypothetical protein [Acidimicrobiales bacterium]